MTNARQGRGALLIAMMLTTHAAAAAALDSVAPPRQAVGELVTLRGAAFGPYVPGTSKVVFTTGGVSIEAGTPYVWRDDFIQVRVPTGQRIDGTNTPLPAGPLGVLVVGIHSKSAPLPFAAAIVNSPLPSMVERTSIVDDRDVSTFLGDPVWNLARTKDADFGDVDGDGWIDVVDSNSNNVFNDTFSVLRTNDAGQGFTALRLEPRTFRDTGAFATTVLFGGDYVGNATIYDTDLVDLDNDGLPDLVQAAVSTIDGNRVRILMNDHEGVPGRFLEQSSAWTGGRMLPNCPDDIAHGDLDDDGWVDVVVALRAFANCGGPTSTVEIYRNLGGTGFADPIILSAPTAVSTHDVFLLDADGDGHKDLVMANESGPTQLLLHDGQTPPGFEVAVTIDESSYGGEAGDLDGDGLDDFVVSGNGFVHVYRNDPDAPGTFAKTALPGTGAIYYDVELGDVDLNGAIDIVVAGVTIVGDESLELWLNDGSGVFTHATPGGDGLFASLESYQRLSVDLLDVDRDGDLDLYLTGADGQDVAEGTGFGRVPNQFFESGLTCVGDLDHDQTVGFGDLLSLLSTWGPCAGCASDLDHDGDVDFGDLLQLLARWGSCAG